MKFPVKRLGFLGMLAATLVACSDASEDDVSIECGADQYEVSPPSATSDRVCADLTVCGADEYEMVAPASTSDRVCAVDVGCDSGEYLVEAATETRPAVCAAFTVCEEGVAFESA